MWYSICRIISSNVLFVRFSLMILTTSMKNKNNQLFSSYYYKVAVCYCFFCGGFNSSKVTVCDKKCQPVRPDDVISIIGSTSNQIKTVRPRKNLVLRPSINLSKSNQKSTKKIIYQKSKSI